MLRGNAGQDIFHDEADRSRFFFLLQEGIARFGHRIHAYCLMSNHVHLVVQVKETALSRIMHNLSFRYTQYLNKKFQQTGHIFQGRFKALLIDAEAYLLALVRYVHRNPLRAGMVANLDDYPWSSHHAYLSRENLPLLTVDWVLSQFSDDAGRSVDHYRDFVEGGQPDGYCREFHRGTYEGRILGDDSFVEEVLAGCHEKLAEPPPLVGAKGVRLDKRGNGLNFRPCQESREFIFHVPVFTSCYEAMPGRTFFMTRRTAVD
ncbi:MAG: transposase, partial [Desulfuromonadales bacterium]|nr:transposase [Desulfuromonadales bacterium]